MGLNNTAKNLMLDALAAGAIYVSLHTADPGATGTDEVTGGSPAYARKSLTWDAASGGSIDSSNQPAFDVPASTTITHIGYWSAATAGTFYGGEAITSETYGGQGTYTLNIAQISLT